jgi:hypothetical protein
VSHSFLLVQRLTFAWAIQAEDWIVVAWYSCHLSRGPSLCKNHFAARIDMNSAADDCWWNLQSD